MITFAIINLILKILLTGLMGVICGLFSYFLDYCMWKGSVFGFYLPWLAQTLVGLFKPVALQEINALNLSKEAREDNLIAEAEGIFFYKMLGGCAVCFNIWVALSSYVVICILSDLEWYYIFPYIMLSSWKIRKLTGAVYKF